VPVAPPTPFISTRTVSVSRKELGKSLHTPIHVTSSGSDDDSLEFEVGNKLVVLKVDGMNEV
jgi:hypothetical protein